MKTTKSILLVIWYGATSINIFSVIGVLLYPFSAYMLFQSKYAPGQVRFIMICTAVFSLFFAGKLLLKSK